jgi:hypothetical protein
LQGSTTVQAETNRGKLQEMTEAPGAATFRVAADAYDRHIAAAKLPPQRRTRLREELGARLGAGDEPFRLTARAWCVVGRVP